jgi:hypothetical protein
VIERGDESVVDAGEDTDIWIDRACIVDIDRVRKERYLLEVDQLCVIAECNAGICAADVAENRAVEERSDQRVVYLGEHAEIVGCDLGAVVFGDNVRRQVPVGQIDGLI